MRAFLHQALNAASSSARNAVRSLAQSPACAELPRRSAVRHAPGTGSVLGGEAGDSASAGSVGSGRCEPSPAKRQAEQCGQQCRDQREHRQRERAEDGDPAEVENQHDFERHQRARCREIGDRNFDRPSLGRLPGLPRHPTRPVRASGSGSGPLSAGCPGRKGLSAGRPRANNEDQATMTGPGRRLAQPVPSASSTQGSVALAGPPGRECLMRPRRMLSAQSSVPERRACAGPGSFNALGSCARHRLAQRARSSCGFDTSRWSHQLEADHPRDRAR